MSTDFQRVRSIFLSVLERPAEAWDASLAEACGADAGLREQVDLLLLDETLAELTRQDPQGGQLVEFRYFAGLTVEEAAAVLGISAATAYRHWAFARAWLHATIARNGQSPRK